MVDWCYNKKTLYNRISNTFRNICNCTDFYHILNIFEYLIAIHITCHILRCLRHIVPSWIRLIDNNAMSSNFENNICHLYRMLCQPSIDINWQAFLILADIELPGWYRMWFGFCNVLMYIYISIYYLRFPPLSPSSVSRHWFWFAI